MKFASVFVATVIASPAAMLLEFQTAQSSAATAKLCWKDFYGLDTNNCAGEMSEGLCYEKCQIGATGFGPYCIQKKGDVFETQERHVIPSGDVVCSANTKLVKAFEQNVCVQETCPATMPYDCLVSCTRNKDECENSVTGTSLAIFEIVKNLNDRDWQSASANIWALWDYYKAIPVCSQVAGSSKADMIASFIQLLKMN